MAQLFLFIAKKTLMEFLDWLLGIRTEYLKPHHMAVRAFIVFFTTLVFIRIAGFRMLGNQSAFDTLTKYLKEKTY